MKNPSAMTEVYRLAALTVQTSGYKVKRGKLGAEVGIEPAYTALQSDAASLTLKPPPLPSMNSATEGG